MRDLKRRDRTVGHENAGLEKAGLENASTDWLVMESHQT